MVFEVMSFGVEGFVWVMGVVRVMVFGGDEFWGERFVWMMEDE